MLGVSGCQSYFARLCFDAWIYTGTLVEQERPRRPQGPLISRCRAAPGWRSNHSQQPPAGARQGRVPRKAPPTEGEARCAGCLRLRNNRGGLTFSLVVQDIYIMVAVRT